MGGGVYSLGLKMSALGFKFDNKQYQRLVELAPCEACISSFDFSIILSLLIVTS